MYLHASDLRRFYDKPLGETVSKILNNTLRNMCPSARGDRLLGLGYVMPVIQPFCSEAERSIVLMPSHMGAIQWPSRTASITALVHEEALPIPDASIDRIIALHYIDRAECPTRTMREIWRVLVPGGKLLTVVPNTLGVWAYFGNTPFSAARSYTFTQIRHLLRQTMFLPGKLEGTLHLPPSERDCLLCYQKRLERMGKTFWPCLCGAITVEAIKQTYQGAVIDNRRRSFAELRQFMPVTSHT